MLQAAQDMGSAPSHHRMPINGEVGDLHEHVEGTAWECAANLISCKQDKNADNREAAAEKFKEIGEAMEVGQSVKPRKLARRIMLGIQSAGEVKDVRHSPKLCKSIILRESKGRSVRPWSRGRT